MKRELEESRGKNWSDFSYVAVDLLFLFPELRNELGLDEAAFRGIKRDVERFYEKERGRHFERDLWIFSALARNLCLLFPSRKNELGLSEAIFNDIFNEIKGTLEDACRSPDWLGFSCMAVGLCILFPDHRSELKLDETVFEEIRNELEHNRSKGSRLHFLSLAANVCLLFPDRKRGLNLNEEVFYDMRNLLEEEERKEHWLGYSDMAMYLSILAAERAEISQDGRILIMPKKPKLSREPRPLPSRLNISV